MKPKHVYLVLCLAGAVLPLAQIVPFVRAHGLAPRLMLERLFAEPVSAFFGMDVMVSALVLVVLVIVEGRRAGMHRLWAPIVATVLVGVSLGLPLFLYLRERRLERPA